MCEKRTTENKFETQQPTRRQQKSEKHCNKKNSFELRYQRENASIMWRRIATFNISNSVLCNSCVIKSHMIESSVLQGARYIFFPTQWCFEWTTGHRARRGTGRASPTCVQQIFIATTRGERNEKYNMQKIEHSNNARSSYTEQRHWIEINTVSVKRWK